jgi:oxygen-independent coproporphyrinogen-3 oxidase
LIWLKVDPALGWHDGTMTLELPAGGPVGLAFDAGLVRKYDGFGPRYTSYPTADRFGDAFGPDEYASALLARRPRDGSASGAPQPLSLYVHVPFCNTICYYCACNKVITKDHGRSAKYIRYLGREIELVAGLIDTDSPVRQLHWGGGTPTFLSAQEMTELTQMLRGRFNFASDAECSIEIDPRKVTAETVKLLAELGFNRMSLGVQDFDPEVQQAVNRIQSEDETRTVLDAARAHGFRSLNVDLIYGLPRQNVASFAVTLDRIVAMAPDRVALYSYAHVPHLFKPQRRIVEAELPPPEEKLAILELAIGRLGAAGYVYIGMDHFALPDDELAIAQRQPTATFSPSAFPRSARSGRPTARTCARWTNTTSASTAACCRVCAASNSAPTISSDAR